MFHRLSGTALIAGIGGTGVCLGGWVHDHDPLMLGFAMATFVVSVLRLAVVVAGARRARQPTAPLAAEQWQEIYGVATVLYYVVIAGAIFSAYHRSRQGVRELLIVGAVSFCAGLNGHMAVPPWVSQICGSLVLAGLGLSMWKSPDAASRFACLIILLFAYVHCRTAQSRFDILVEHLRDRRKLRQLAECDALTGLANRRFFQQKLAEACDAGEACAVFFIDLDHFKEVNDSLGHAAGDTLLRMVAERLRASVRAEDLVARFGGDEFAIMQRTDVNLEAAKRLAGRINRSIAETFHIDGAAVRIGASVGIRLRARSEGDPVRILNEADEALYRVKREGRGGFAFAT
jgi:diguanylate cyclase (GGDEF)-like protein